MTLADLCAAFFANDQTKERCFQRWSWQSDVGWLCHDNGGILRRENGIIEIGIPKLIDNNEYPKYSEHWQECVDAAKLPLKLIKMTAHKTVIDTPWGHKVFTRNTWISLAELLGPPSCE